MPNVAYIRPELKTEIPRYRLIADCIHGETAVKAGKESYLPKPNAADTSPENSLRYEAYIKRAVFYNVTKRTLDGFLGSVFIRQPEIKTPSQLKKVVDNASGAGVSLIQQSKKALSYTLSFGRCGLFVDYPSSEVATVADIESGAIRPILSLYRPEEIVNWRVQDSGAEEILSLIVLREQYVAKDDGFEIAEGIQYRVLELLNGVYTQSLWRDTSQSFAVSGSALKQIGNGIFEKLWSIVPTDSSGLPFTRIPFVFIGSESNDSEIDPAPLYDLASLNIAHYRNSADYEESCYIVGQPTPYFTGLTEEWVERVLKGKVALGARAAVALPAGAAAGLIQATANGLAKEALEQKERQMVALGAKLVEQSKVQRTAFEARLESASESSVLSTIVDNVSFAYTQALQIACQYVGTNPAGVEFKLNSDFDLSSLGAEDRNQAIAEWQAGAITFGEMRAILRKAGIATEDDEIAKAAVDELQ